MFRQYTAVKNDHPDAILLFRMGDFYEMFFEDAKRASKLLELTLTARGKGTANVVPMCGFPHHQLENYTARLVRAQERVAVCEQVEDPKTTKGLVRREVVRVVTPGTVVDPDQLDASENVWVAAIHLVAGQAAAAFLDASTGEFLVWESGPGDDGCDTLLQRLREFEPRELVLAEEFKPPAALAGRLQSSLISRADPYSFNHDTAAEQLRQHLDVASLDGFGLKDRPVAVAAAGALLQYVRDTQKCGLEQINSLRFHDPGQHLRLDAASRRNLEIESSLRDGGRRGTLLEAVDQTVTPAGARMLRRWLHLPLLDLAQIARRQDAVEELLSENSVRAQAREHLNEVRDIERLVTRCVTRSALPRDLGGLRTSLERIPAWSEAHDILRSPLVRQLLDELDPCTDVCRRLQAGVVDDPPASLRDGGVIREGFNEELDDLRNIGRDGRAYISALEAKEREATGISSLKVKFNKVFGYFIEVTKSNLAQVPEHYHRKQTIANGERYITPELKDHESRVLNAQDRVEELEARLFAELRDAIAKDAARLQRLARDTACMDVLCSLAQLARTADYRRPHVTDGDRLSIRKGRHPVVEQALGHGRFIANDCDLQIGARGIAILTGPNMGGKSTFLRQTALITLLAQTGSFVPAEEATIGVVDRIFCRVGASDNLVEGQSTFMVEMTETANILNHAGPRSLLLLDEIGRGTSTFDGLSIAWSIVEHLDQSIGIPRTLFATHYHEMTELETERAGIFNLRMAVQESGDDVVFTHRVEAGPADRSYGIQVARLAGLPQQVIDRAREILADLEGRAGGRGLPHTSPGSSGRYASRQQPSLFEVAESTPAAVAPHQELIDELRNLTPNEMTPLEALQLIVTVQRRLRDDPNSD